MSKPVFLLCGYKGTGKDTFFKDLCFHNLKQTTETECKWLVYASPNVDRFKFENLLSEYIKRFAFADALKSMTHEALQFIDCPPYAFEKVKESLQVINPFQKNEVLSIRNLYIFIGQQQRARNPDVWLNIIQKQIQNEKLSTSVITDFRFENEMKNWNNMEVFTIRLFRANVPIPEVLENREIDSEHNLDLLETDFILVPPNDVHALHKQFPQYKNYQLFHRLNEK